jgi:hypothetical protein
METFVTLGIIAGLLGIVVWVMWGQELKVIKPDRRKIDIYRIYNEQEDKTETLFDRRADTTDIK